MKDSFGMLGEDGGGGGLISREGLPTETKFSWEPRSHQSESLWGNPTCKRYKQSCLLESGVGKEGSDLPPPPQPPTAPEGF